MIWYFKDVETHGWKQCMNRLSKGNDFNEWLKWCWRAVDLICVRWFEICSWHAAGKGQRVDFVIFGEFKCLPVGLVPACCAGATQPTTRLTCCRTWVAVRHHTQHTQCFFLVRSNMLSFRSQCSPTPIPMASGDGVCLGIEGIRRDVFVNMP